GFRRSVHHVQPAHTIGDARQAHTTHPRVRVGREADRRLVRQHHSLNIALLERAPESEGEVAGYAESVLHATPGEFVIEVFREFQMGVSLLVSKTVATG